MATHREQVTAQPVETTEKVDEIDHAQGTDLPFIELNAERLLGEMRAEPAVANSDEEEAQAARQSAASPAWEFAVRTGWCSGSGAEPESDGPDGLPGKQIEGPGFLERDLQMGDVDDPVVDQVAQAELREKPDAAAGEENPFSIQSALLRRAAVA